MNKKSVKEPETIDGQHVTIERRIERLMELTHSGLIGHMTIDSIQRYCLSGDRYDAYCLFRQRLLNEIDRKPWGRTAGLESSIRAWYDTFNDIDSAWLSVVDDVQETDLQADLWSSHVGNEVRARVLQASKRL